jgi:DNA-binding MarR family transcriptional regulator
MTEQYPQALQTLTRLITALRKIDPEFPLQYALCLILVARHEGLSVTDLSRKAGLNLSTVSRIIATLSMPRPQSKIDYSLIDMRIVAQERRRKEIFLTQRGRGLIQNMIEIIEIK